MKRTLGTLLLLLISPSVFAAESEPQSLLYLSESAPIFIRLHIEIDGGSYEEPWNRFVDQLFEDLDQNGDGMVSGNEASRIPTPQQLAQTGLQLRQQTNRPTGDVTRQQIDEYLRKLSGGPFSLNVTQQNQNNSTRLRAIGMPNSAAQVDIFEHLDSDQNGKLSAQEFALSTSLRKLDLDDDETISSAELQPAMNPYMYAGASRGQTTTFDASPFLHLDGSQSPTKLVRQLIERYDVKQDDEEKDNKLSRAEMGMAESSFGELDIDDDGNLDFDELRQFIRKPKAQLDLVIRLGSRKNGEDVVEIQANKHAVPGEVRKTADGQLNLVVGKVHVEIGSQNSGQSVRQNYEATYKQLFKQYDTDNNAYLEQKETDRTQFRNTFDLIDRDGDGKIFEEELLAYAKQVAAAAESRTILTVTDQGNKLFQIVDLNRDGRLNARELSAARGKVSAWDEDGDEEVTKEEIPQNWRLALSRGNSVSAFGALQAVSYAGGGQPIAQNAAGPSWFQKMDRNRDGDVTEREFLGRPSDFQKLDTDGDGLLSPDEADSVKSE